MSRPHGNVGLSDLVPFSEEFLGLNGGLCHDYDNDGNTGLEDLTIFAEAVLQGSACP